MAKFLVFRLAGMLAILVVISALVFVVTELLPGNVATMILGNEATPAEVANLQRLLGLDQPAWVRFTDWMGGLVAGNFGQSLRMQRPIGPILAERLGNSLVLTGVSLVFVVVGGFVLALVTALREGSRLDRVLTAVSVVGTSLPEFVSGTLLVLVFAGGVVSLLPPSGYEGFEQGIGDGLAHLVLPAATLGLVLAAYVGRVARASLVEVLHSDYVRAARLKGLPEWRVVLTHALPNVLVPALTVLSMNLGWMFGGIVVVEEIFVFPGIGRLMLFAIAERDWPVIQACAVVIASVYVIGNAIGDMAALLVDPRLREAGR